MIFTLIEPIAISQIVNVSKLNRISYIKKTSIMISGLVSLVGNHGGKILRATGICIIGICTFGVKIQNIREMSNVDIASYIANNNGSNRSNRELQRRVSLLSQKMNITPTKAIIINPNNNVMNFIDFIPAEITMDENKYSLVFPSNTPSDYLIAHGIAFVKFYDYFTDKVRQWLYSVEYSLTICLLFWGFKSFLLSAISIGVLTGHTFISIYRKRYSIEERILYYNTIENNP